VPDRADDSRPIALAAAGGVAELRPQRGQVEAWSSQAGVQKTIEDALRSAGLMK